MRLRLSNLALRDIEDIHDYTCEEWGTEQAERYSGQIADALEMIARTPERWRLRNEIHPGCRVCLSGKHAILYRVREGKVEASRILHGAMNLPQHVPPDFMGDQ
jgi:toxin ParE1/3/4